MTAVGIELGRDGAALDRGHHLGWVTSGLVYIGNWEVLDRGLALGTERHWPYITNYCWQVLLEIDHGFIIL